MGERNGEKRAGAERLYGALYGESSPEDIGLAAWHSVLTEPYWLNDALVAEGSIR